MRKHYDSSHADADYVWLMKISVRNDSWLKMINRNYVTMQIHDTRIAARKMISLFSCHLINYLVS